MSNNEKTTEGPERNSAKRRNAPAPADGGSLERKLAQARAKRARALAEKGKGTKPVLSPIEGQPVAVEPSAQIQSAKRPLRSILSGGLSTFVVVFLAAFGVGLGGVVGLALVSEPRQTPVVAQEPEIAEPEKIAALMSDDQTTDVTAASNVSEAASLTESELLPTQDEEEVALAGSVIDPLSEAETGSQREPEVSSEEISEASVEAEYATTPEAEGQEETALAPEAQEQTQADAEAASETEQETRVALVTPEEQPEAEFEKMPDVQAETETPQSQNTAVLADDIVQEPLAEMASLAEAVQPVLVALPDQQEGTLDDQPPERLDPPYAWSDIPDMAVVSQAAPTEVPDLPPMEKVSFLKPEVDPLIAQSFRGLEPPGLENGTGLPADVAVAARASVFLHVPDGVPRGRINEMIGQLEGANVEVAKIGREPFRVSATHLRYYSEESAGFAQRLAADLGIEARPFSNARVDPERVELWVRGLPQATEPERKPNFLERLLGISDER